MGNTAEKYNDTAVHYSLARLPRLLLAYLPPGPLALAEFGCGDGPFFQALEHQSFIGPAKPVYAVDLEQRRLEKVSSRFPYIRVIVSSADSVPEIPDASLDFIISTMVLEHVPDEVRFLSEIKRTLNKGGRAYLTTVFKKKWAWYFRKRNGESVLDTSHLREYTDLDLFRHLVENKAGLRILHLETRMLWFPIVYPLAFRLFKNNTLFNNPIVEIIRLVKIPILGYYNLNLVVDCPH